MLTFRSLLLLGALGLGDHHGVAAWPKPSGNVDSHNKRQGTVLGLSSSCNDIANYQTENNLPHIQADMFDMLGASGVIDEYNFGPDYGHFTNFVGGFAAPYVYLHTSPTSLKHTMFDLSCRSMALVGTAVVVV